MRKGGPAAADYYGMAARGESACNGAQTERKRRNLMRDWLRRHATVIAMRILVFGIELAAWNIARELWWASVPFIAVHFPTATLFWMIYVWRRDTPAGC